MQPSNLHNPAPRWRRLHADSIVWILHDHFYHRLDANLRMLRGGVTAKVAVPVGDLAIYNDSQGSPGAKPRRGVGHDSLRAGACHEARHGKPPPEHDREFYERTLAQTEGWAKESLLRLERARRLYESRPDRFILAHRVADVVRAQRQGKAAVFLGFEGCKAFEGRIELLHVFHRLGVRQMQLTWSNPNQLVAVARSSGAWTLSAFGCEAVAAMNELGIVIDLAHAPWSLLADVVARSRHAVIVSHASPADAHPGSGDMTAQHLDALKSCGGLLGLHFCRHYINGPAATFDDFLDTIDYLVERGYEDLIALGGDLFEDDSYFRARHGPPGGATHETWKVFIDELSDIARIPNVTRGLVSRGYPTRLIKRILGGNAMRVYRAILGG